MVESKREIIEKFIKKNGFVWIMKISRKTGISYATVHKWVRILELEGKVKTKEVGGMRVVEWVGKK